MLARATALSFFFAVYKFKHTNFKGVSGVLMTLCPKTKKTYFSKIVCLFNLNR